MDARLKLCWFASVLFRLLNAVAQTGYTHPDEYFQSVEVMAGDIFDLRVRVPWEFNATRPLRSVTSIGLFVGFPLALHKLGCDLLGRLYDFHVIHLLPRLVNVALSLICDLCLFRMSSDMKENSHQVLFLFWTSFPLYTHLLRPLSNAWETFYLCGLLLLTSARVRPMNAVFQGLLIALAFFCRPTFAVFAAVPLLSQLLRILLRMGSIRAFAFHVLLAISFCAASALCAFLDSIYFGGATSPSLVLTPLNFLGYNLQADNLSSHGRHPWFTHLLSSLPQLFGPGALLLALLPLQSGGIRRTLPWLAVFAAPLALLSLFCHQEMRFLLPLVPLAARLLPVALQPLGSRLRRGFFTTWAAFHLLSLLFWGYAHQAGVVPALHHLRELQQETPDRCHHTFFLYSYMPPEFLLARPRLGHSCSHLHDLAGSLPSDGLWKVVANAMWNSRTGKAFVVFPSSAHDSVLKSGLRIRLHECAMFPYHVTTEKLPDPSAVLNRGLSETLYALKNVFSMIACPVYFR